MTIPSDTPPPFYSGSRTSYQTYGCSGAILDSILHFTETASEVAKIIFLGCFGNMCFVQPKNPSAFEMRLQEVKTSTFTTQKTENEYAKIRKKIRDANNAADIFDQPLNHSECTKKYRNIVKLLHPDKNPGNELEASLLFHCVQEAYEKLERKYEKQTNAAPYEHAAE